MVLMMTAYIIIRLMIVDSMANGIHLRRPFYLSGRPLVMFHRVAGARNHLRRRHHCDPSSWHAWLRPKTPTWPPCSLPRLPSTFLSAFGENTWKKCERKKIKKGAQMVSVIDNFRILSICVFFAIIKKSEMRNNSIDQVQPSLFGAFNTS